MNDPAIKTIDLTKKYRGNGKNSDLSAVDSLNLKIDKGEIFGLLGKNGSGKTTTIKMLTCQITPTSGYALVKGYNITKFDDQMKIKSIVGYLPESPFLYENLTGIEFLEFIGKLRKIPEDEIKKRVNYLFEMFDLNDYANSLIKTYSKGTRQKIALCSALIHNPPILFLDEPFQGLDPLISKIVKDLIKEYANEGKTIFISTHILEVAEKLCTSVGIISKGKLIYTGRLDQLKKENNNKDLEEIFVSLIGSSD